jgi:short-subunit dehydrogenase
LNVSDKIAVVTGASSGIGLATAKLLTQRGAKVALVARSKDKLDALASELVDSFVVTADMTKRLDVENAFKAAREHYGRVDILVNCAGRGYDVPVEKTDVEVFHYIFDLDVVGPVVAMEQVIPLMRKQGEGAIVNVSSGTALMLLPNNGPYAGLKRALAHISLTAREELKKDHVAVSVVYPYITATDFEKNTIKGSGVTWEEEGEGPPFPPDTAEFAAAKILEAVETGAAEVFAHEWMRKPRDNAT